MLLTSLKKAALAASAAVLLSLTPSVAQAQWGFFGNPWANPFARSRPLPAFGNPFAIRSIGPDQFLSVYTPNGFVHGAIGAEGPYVPAPQIVEPVELPAGNPMAAAGLGLIVAADTAAQQGGQASGATQAPSATGSVSVKGDNVNITVNKDRYGRAPIPRSSETVDAKFDKDNRLAVTWSGDAKSVARVRFFLLDKDRKVIKEEVVTAVPATARFTLTNKTAYYQVQVEYSNGTTNSVVSPI